MNITDLDHYPADWPVIARSIRAERADNRCECDGRCNDQSEGIKFETHIVTITGVRCFTRNSPGFPITVVSLDFQPGNVDPDNLMAMCPDCRLAYTAEHEAEALAARLARRRGNDGAEVHLPGLGIEL